MELGLINSLGPGLITGVADEDPSTIDLSTIDRLWQILLTILVIQKRLRQ